MVQIIPQDGDLFGRIGKGIGQGFSEQIPRAVENHYLAEGLSKLQGSSAKSPLEQATALLRIPGMSAEKLQQFLPLLQQQQQRDAFARRSSGGQTAQGEAASAQPSSNTQVRQQPNAQLQGRAQSQGVQDNGFATPSQIAKYKESILQEPGTEEINNLANEYISQGLTQDPAQAVALARQEVSQNLTEQRAKTAALRQDLDARIKLGLQGGGFGEYKDLTGKIQKELLDQGEYMVNQLGLTPEAASDRLDDIAQDLGEAYNNLKETGSFINMFRSSKEKSRELRAQKEEFEKLGFGEIFDDLATAQLGITPLQAAHVLDPLKNEHIKNEISKIPKVISPKATKLDASTLDKIILSITPKDNLYAIQYELRDKGVDLQQFKDRLDELKDKKDIVLTSQQKRQQRRTTNNSFLGDLLYQSF